MVFFDEFDAIAGERSDVSHSATESQVAALLAELDGIEECDDLLMLAATNRRKAIDDAVIRPGRFDEIIEVPPPGTAGQADIFDIHTDPLPTIDDVTSSWFVSESPSKLTGADIAGICKEAFHAAVGATQPSDDIEITREHIQTALDMVCSSDHAEVERDAFQ